MSILQTSQRLAACILMLSASSACVSSITGGDPADEIGDPDSPDQNPDNPDPDPDDPNPDPDDPNPEPAPWWQPAPGTTWQWQLSGTIATNIDVQMYDIDLFAAPQSKIDQLHANGRIVICYFSAGSIEDWRVDAGNFPPSSIGYELDGWEGENWIDIRNTAVRDVMKARMDLAVAKGCDGVEPDNVDGYANDSGFNLSGADQLDFNRFLAHEAHARGLSVGLKNDVDQINALVDDFDWALNEECFEYDECDTMAPFIQAGKAVFQVEYGNSSTAADICDDANNQNIDSLVKNLELDAYRIACR